ncbi:hypothetical protein E2C01_064017 [Portunus trituberculatus]|uniref:Uncharacterized protein n=1 Tax=Portunus trituberculatus TaxID=210409 RepID=A0A5B7HIM2_PORTR|nr:hypothetical protein [Portunus trituberculatus]
MWGRQMVSPSPLASLVPCPLTYPSPPTDTNRNTITPSPSLTPPSLSAASHSITPTPSPLLVQYFQDNSHPTFSFDNEIREPCLFLFDLVMEVSGGATPPPSPLLHPLLPPHPPSPSYPPSHPHPLPPSLTPPVTEGRVNTTHLPHTPPLPQVGTHLSLAHTRERVT